MEENRGRKPTLEQTPERILHNKRVNLYRKFKDGKITKKEHIRLLAEANIEYQESKE